MEIKYKKPIRVAQWIYQFKRRFGYYPDIRKTIWTIDNVIIPNYRFAQLDKIAAALNCQIKTRKEITDYRSRRVPRIRIGKYAYYLIGVDR